MLDWQNVSRIGGTPDYARPISPFCYRLGSMTSRQYVIDSSTIVPLEEWALQQSMPAFRGTADPGEAGLNAGYCPALSTPDAAASIASWALRIVTIAKRPCVGTRRIRATNSDAGRATPR